MKQPWSPSGRVSRFPQELATFPWGSNSITGGAWRPESSSFSVMFPRLAMNTWSWASVQTPLTAPVTHLFGSVLGHEGSTSYLGGLPCAAKGYVQRIINTVANAAASTATMRQVIFAFSFISLFP